MPSVVSLNRYWMLPLLLVMFGISVIGIQTQSLWLDEAWTAHAVYDNARLPETLREVARNGRDSLLHTLNTLRDDVHPPLYFLLLDGWTFIMGESEFALRVPSALVGVLAIAGVFALGRTWFDTRTGLLAALLLGTASFYLYYTREARMYTLYLALTTLGTWAYSLWFQRRTAFRAMLYAVLMAAALYTHYLSALVFVAHLTHYLILKPHWKMVFPFGAAVLPFVAWMPFLRDQLNANPTGASADFVASNLSGLAAFWLMLTSGYAIIFLLILVFSRAPMNLRRDKQARSAVMLVIVMFGVMLVTLLVANSQDFTIFQIRYLIPLLPMWMLIVAWLLRHVRVPFLTPRPLAPSPTGGEGKRVAAQRATPLRYVSTGLMLFFAAWLVYTQLSMYEDLWDDKPYWRDAVQAVLDVRQPLQPALHNLPDDHPAAYYQRQVGYTDGIAVDIGWQPFAPQEIARIVNQFVSAEQVWLFAPAQDPSTWDALAELVSTQSRSIAYRHSVDDFVLYSFGDAAGLQPIFTFGDLFLYDSPLYQQWQATRGETFCVPLALTATTDINLEEGYAYGMYLTRGYNMVITQVDARLNPLATNRLSTGDVWDTEACLDIPTTTAQGIYHVRLALYDSRTLERFSVTERGNGWGDYLMLGQVIIE